MKTICDSRGMHSSPGNVGLEIHGSLTLVSKDGVETDISALRSDLDNAMAKLSINRSETEQSAKEEIKFKKIQQALDAISEKLQEIQAQIDTQDEAIKQVAGAQRKLDKSIESLSTQVNKQLPTTYKKQQSIEPETKL